MATNNRKGNTPEPGNSMAALIKGSTGKLALCLTNKNATNKETIKHKHPLAKAPRTTRENRNREHTPGQ